MLPGVIQQPLAWTKAWTLTCREGQKGRAPLKSCVGIQELLGLKGGGILELIRVMENRVEQWEHHGAPWKESVQTFMAAHPGKQPVLLLAR